MTTTAIRALTLALIGVATASRASETSLRCDGGLISLGDMQLDLLGKCGEPALRDRRSEERAAAREPDSSNAGTYWGGGAGEGVGLGANGGGQVLGSNAPCIGALAGLGTNIGAGGGWSAAADAFCGPSPSPGGPPILGGGLTFGAGYGATSFVGPVVTAVAPVGSLW